MMITWTFVQRLVGRRILDSRPLLGFDGALEGFRIVWTLDEDLDSKREHENVNLHNNSSRTVFANRDGIWFDSFSQLEDALFLRGLEGYSVDH